MTPGRFSSRAKAAQSGSIRRRWPVSFPARPNSRSSRASSVTSSANGHANPAAAARFRLSWTVERATPDEQVALIRAHPDLVGRAALAGQLTAASSREQAAAGLGALADLGFTGLDPDPGDPVIITGYKSTRASKTTPAQRQANQALSAARAPVEHGFSDLKNWRTLTRLRLGPAKATTLLRALLVLTRQHTTR